MIFQHGKQFTVFFRRATEKGLWDKILQHLVEMTRKKAGRNPTPTFAIVDSQSVKTVYASKQIDFDGGRKRHIVVDSLGCLLAVKVHRANLPDTKSGIFVAISAHRKYPSIQKVTKPRSIILKFLCAVNVA